MKPRGWVTIGRENHPSVGRYCARFYTLGLSPTAHKQLKGLALDQDKTAEILLAEAVRDLFAKYGKPAID